MCAVLSLTVTLLLAMASVSFTLDDTFLHAVGGECRSFVLAVVEGSFVFKYVHLVFVLVKL